jgi:hypothetical protein
MDNSLHIPPDAVPSRSETRVKIALLEAHRPSLGCYFSNRVFSVDSINASGGLYSLGASLELEKERVSEMFTSLNLTLNSFGPQHLVPLVKIGNSKKFRYRKTKAIKWYISHSQHAIIVGKKASKTKTARTYAPTQHYAGSKYSQTMGLERWLIVARIF